MLFDVVPTPEEVITGEAWGSRTSWIVALVTGKKLFQQGTHSLIDVVALALRWKVWSSVAMWWAASWLICSGFCVYLGLQPVSKGGQDVFLIFIVAVNAAVIYFAMGVVVVRLCVLSAFGIPRVFNPCRQLAVRTPDVKAIWWYLSPFLPLLWGWSAVMFLLAVS